MPRQTNFMDEPTNVVEVAWASVGESPDLLTLLADNRHWSPGELRAALLVNQQFRSLTPQP